MCSTPKGSGSTCEVRRFVDDGADYAAYSSMLRRASAKQDQRQREAQLKQQEAAVENTESPLIDKSVVNKKQKAFRQSLFSWLIGHLT